MIVHILISAKISSYFIDSNQRSALFINHSPSELSVMNFPIAETELTGSKKTIERLLTHATYHDVLGA